MVQFMAFIISNLLESHRSIRRGEIVLDGGLRDANAFDLGLNVFIFKEHVILSISDHPFARRLIHIRCIIIELEKRTENRSMDNMYRLLS